MIDKQADLHLRINVKNVIDESLTHALHADNYARERHVPFDPGFETTRACAYTYLYTYTYNYRVVPRVFSGC